MLVIPSPLRRALRMACAIGARKAQTVARAGLQVTATTRRARYLHRASGVPRTPQVLRAQAAARRRTDRSRRIQVLRARDADGRVGNYCRRKSFF